MIIYHVVITIDAGIESEWLDKTKPTLVVWSERDVVIPVKHAHSTHEHLPESQLIVFPGAGHEPHRRHAVPFADAVALLVAGG